METITATPNPVSAGGELEIDLSGFPANQEVKVKLDNGFGDEQTLTVSVDASGNGSTTWTVPDSGWDLVNINAGTALEETVGVQDPANV